MVLVSGVAYASFHDVICLMSNGLIDWRDGFARFRSSAQITSSINSQEETLLRIEIPN